MESSLSLAPLSDNPRRSEAAGHDPARGGSDFFATRDPDAVTATVER
jgi:hypothetical protein